MAIKHRIKSKSGFIDVNLTPIKAIRTFCMECMCWVITEITACTAHTCPLYPFRMGHAHSGRKGNVASLPHRRQKAV